MTRVLLAMLLLSCEVANPIEPPDGSARPPAMVLVTR